MTDVAKIMTQLMKSEVKNDKFTLIAQNIVFGDLFNSIADALKVKRPSIYVSPLLTRFLWRIDWLVSTVFRTKRKLDRATAIASYSKNLYSNEKIMSTLKTEFLDIHQYIKEISSL